VKRGWKIFWIVIAVIVAIGMVFCAIALCMGVSFYNLRKDYFGSRLIRLIDDWDGDSYNDWDDEFDDDWEEDLDDDWDDSDEQHHHSGETTALSENDFKNITELKMSIGRCKVIITPAAQDYIHIDTSKLYYQEYDMELKVEQEGNKLRIESLKEGKVWDVIGAIKHHETNGLAGTLTVYIPQDLTLALADLSFGGCDVKIRSLTADKATIRSGAADCELEQVNFGTLNAEVGAGDLDLTGTITGDITAKCGAGDLDFKLVGKESDYNYALKCGAGDLEINDHEYGGLAKVKNIDNNSSKTIYIVCGAGDVNLEFTTR